MKRRQMGNISNASKTEDWENGSVDVPSLPVAVLEEIFQNLPAEQVVCVCRLVCREWRDVVDCACLWKERCRREGLRPSDPVKTPSDWRLFYILCKKRRNLLKNPKAEDGFARWELIENGGDKWKIEGVSVEHPDGTVNKHFATSYFSCMKRQVVDLQAEGYSPAFMDEFQPDILISDWYAPRWDCGCEYEISVQLLSAGKKVLKSFSPDKVNFEQWNDQKWNQVTHVFRSYGRGVRYVGFIHGGKDTQFWAGWYGIRVTNSSVEICPAGETKERVQPEVLHGSPENPIRKSPRHFPDLNNGKAGR
ncbi:F-box only protein 6-like [Clupea harengus]|uniref:F-box only protein 6-like n=1 Tax=Clupea harengus TaxID=7950 RepID=A0A6P8FE47_CLUHA|nr:F-box only protein 6-like [Clupea harengus]XP_012690522.1 F-box only protein 6-like [Clupea harengus]XP_031421995.1 F-box only protein 6-like [Clupea harengus]